MKEDNADWCDENVKIASEIFAEEVRAKNRPGSHLNKLGYNNVMVKFKERTGKTYSELQFKNKWDKLKKDYSNWKQLGKRHDVVGTLTRSCMLLQIGGGRRQT